MGYFTIGRTFLFPSFGLEAEEERNIVRFLRFLDDSGVGEVIARYVKNGTAKGGRPSCNYYRLFAAVLYGFAFDRYTLRGIADACRHDLRYIFIMDQVRVDFTTVCKFINKVIVPNEAEIFGLICRRIAAEAGISLDDVFVDGTKMEANANKYGFVWKPVTFHRRLTASAYEAMEAAGVAPAGEREELIRGSTIARAISALPPGEPRRKALTAMMEKALEYEEKEEICGPGRKSYYKADNDATAMCLKADYYSGLGSNMHAAYNVQCVAAMGLVLGYCVTQSRADSPDFIQAVESFRAAMGVYPKRVCADAGYGTLANYRYLKERGIESFVKHQSWEGNVSGAYPDSYSYSAEGGLVCLAGARGRKVSIPGRHPKSAGASFYRVEGCAGCAFAAYCKRYMKNRDEDFRVFEVVEEMQILKGEAVANLLSPKGIEMRVNRSIQVEGVFGIVKRDYGRERYNRRGMERVTAETMLYFLGLDLAKLFRFFATGRLGRFWKAPPDLEAQAFRKPSAKRLSKKGARISEKIDGSK